MKRFTAGLAIAACVLATAATRPPSTSKNREGPNPAVVEKLRAIIDLRQSIVAAADQAAQNGKSESDGRFEIALAEARRQLALELGEPSLEMAALNDLLRVQRHQLLSAETRMNLGAISPTVVNEQRAEILVTEVRILRAQQQARHPE
jgi:hypothetical protein